MKRDLDKYFPRNGSCVWHPTRYARHRIIDAIRGRYRAGDKPTAMAADYNLPLAAIKAAIYSTPDDNRMTPKEIRDSAAYNERLRDGALKHSPKIRSK